MLAEAMPAASQNTLQSTDTIHRGTAMTDRHITRLGATTISRRRLLELGALGLAATALPLSAAAKDKKLKVAAIFATPIEEPWDHQIHVALQRAEKELGIEYKWSEKVEAADFSRVMREYAQGGYELVLGDAFAAELSLIHI